MESKLSARQHQFVAHFVKGASAADAARSAGYGKAYAAKAGKFILSQDRVREAVDAAQGALRKSVQFSVEDAVADAARKAAMWETTNPMASFKATELVSRLLGYLVERLHMKVETIDIGGTLLEARKRSLQSIAQDVEFAMIAAPGDPPVDPFG